MTMMKPHDFGYSDAELMRMSIDERNAVLHQLTQEQDEQAGFHPRDPRLSETCPVTHGYHDWSEESWDADPAAATFIVCIACGIRRAEWLEG